MSVFGTRPDTTKMAPVVEALRAAGPAIESLVCVTAQHRGMLDDLLALFAIRPDFDLDVMTPNQTLTQITTRVLQGMEPVLAEARPEVILVHGDTSTSTAAALAAFYARIPVGHVEAGLRTSTIWEPYPEELNRRLTGVIAAYHFAPTAWARTNLIAENIASEQIFVTGNTAVDAFTMIARRPLERDPVEWNRLDSRRPLILVTAHRRENHERMPEICAALAEIAALPQRPQILWPVHPSPKVRPIAHEMLGGVEGVILVEPMTYHVLARAISLCHLVLTDSGGIQEEAPSLGKPVLVMRDETERPEGVRAGISRLIGAKREAIVEAVTTLLTDKAAYERMSRAHNPFGDGQAAGRIVAWLLAELRGQVYPEEFSAIP
jgi:UDP-N-acetylglucosamine 2-epimerase (non-hydrolysing)